MTADHPPRVPRDSAPAGRRSLLIGASTTLSALALSACAPVALLNADISTSDLTIRRDIAYAPGPRHGLDIYRADAAPGRVPVVVFIYGGRWENGRKQDYLFAAAALARRGLLVVVPDYRVYPQAGFPGFVEDAAQAVAWTRAHAGEYGGDPDAITLVGHSAGAHIAALLALDPHYLAAAGTSRDRLAGMVGLAGPYDFLPITDPDLQAVFASAPNPAATQPISFVDGHNRPMLLLAGAEDTTVRPGNTERLAARIAAAGGPVTARIYPGLDHVGIVLALTPRFRDRAPVLDDIVGFIKGGG